MSIRKKILSFRLFFVLACFIPSFVQAQKIIRVPKLEFYFQGLKLTQKETDHKPKVGLVLSGGGARGLAQIGVLRSLEKHHIPIDFIVGNSMGSVVGGLYASGYSTAELEKIATHTDWDDVLSFSEETKRTELFISQKEADQIGYLTIRFDGLVPIIPSSISSGQRLINYLMNLTLQSPYHPDSLFDDLKIPFRAVAVDLIKGNRTTIDHGSLAEAMRSSITVPFLYTPLERDSMALVDGGLISNIPVDIALQQKCNVIIAVNSTSGLRHPSQMQTPWEVADQIMSIIMQQPNNDQLAKANIVISPDVGKRLVADFSNPDSLILAGERATDSQIEKIQELLFTKESNDYSYPDSTLYNVQIDVYGKYIPEKERHEIGASSRVGQITIHTIEDQLTRLNASQRYDDVYAEITSTDSTTHLVYHLRLQPIIQHVEFTGNSVISSEEIVPVVHDLEGTVLNYEQIQKTLEKVVAIYRKDKYSLARITDVNVDAKQGLVSFTINEGMVRDVICTGNTKAKDYVIRREFPWQYEDVFTLDKANAGLTNISSTGLFEYILMDVRYMNQQPTIVLKVKERSAEFLRLGIHADNENDIVGTVIMRDADFRGAGEDVSLLLRYGYKNRFARAEYRANRIFKTYLTFDLEGYVGSRDVLTYQNDPMNSTNRWERLEFGKYRETRIGGSLAFGSQLARFGDVTAEFRTERQIISGISGDGYDNEDYRFASIKLQTIFDTENKFIFPTEGIYFSLAYENALKGLGSDVSFTKISATWSAYHTVFNKHTLHPRFTVGFADETLPLAEQFSLGGLNSFFGLQNDDSRGRQLFLGSFEYRITLPFRILFNTYLSARYDLGTISTLPEELKLNKFRHGIGLQLGLETPIGAAIFAAGKSFFFRSDVNDSPVSAGPLMFYFTIGPNL